MTDQPIRDPLAIVCVDPDCADFGTPEDATSPHAGFAGRLVAGSFHAGRTGGGKSTSSLPDWMTESPDIMAQLREQGLADALKRLRVTPKEQDVDDPWDESDWHPVVLTQRQVLRRQFRQFTHACHTLWRKESPGGRYVILNLDMRDWGVRFSKYYGEVTVQVGPFSVHSGPPPF